MIDYKEMERVIQDLNSYVEKLHKTEETQKMLGDTINQLAELCNNIGYAENKIEQYTKVIVELESTHDVIKSQFDTVLQDYKKLHSAFELLDIELKKSNAKYEGLQICMTEVRDLSKNIEVEISKLNIAEEKILNNQQSGFSKLESLINENKECIVNNQQEVFDKLNVAVENVYKETTQLVSMAKGISHAQEECLQKITSDIKELKKQNLKNHNELMITMNDSARKNKIWFGVLTGLISSVLILSIVGLFI
jgi:chromosome segregation ATPase